MLLFSLSPFLPFALSADPLSTNAPADLTLTLLTAPAAENFHGTLAGGGHWWIASNLCTRAAFTATIPTNGIWTLEVRDHVGSPATWYRLGAPLTGPVTNTQTLSVPAPSTGAWFYRLRQTDAPPP